MTNRVIGAGIPLPQAQALYPANLSSYGDPVTPAQNTLSLAPGQSIQIPAGDWLIDLGKYSILEYQDPTNYAAIAQTVGVWRPIRSQRGTFTLRSDGVNFRISNLTGCVVGAQVTNGGASYVAATTTIVPSVGNSTWQAIIGGRIAHLTCSVVGANYGVAPVVFLSPPPNPGVQATAIAAITTGAVSGFTVINQGAGYTTAPTVTILPNPFDPNLAGTTAYTTAVAVSDLTGSGTLSAALCTNSGVPVATTMTLTVTGGNASGNLTPVFLTTLASLTITAGGSGTITGAALTTIGGVPNSNIYTNPAIELTDFIPRQAQVELTVSAGLVTGATIIDGGMFLNTVRSVITTTLNTSATPIAPTVLLTQGSANDTIILQPL